MKKTALLALITLISTACSTATRNPGNFPENNSTSNLDFKPSNRVVRIKSLWPSSMADRLAIEPAIPDNFVLGEPPQNSKFYWGPPGTFYWGPKDVLEAVFKDPSSLKSPIIKLFLSPQVIQTGPKTFNDDPIRLKATCLNNGMKNVQVQTTMWGTYPVLSFKGTLGGIETRTAWIGLNDCSRSVLGATILSSKGNRNVDRAVNRIWNTFIQKTQELSFPELFIANGHDLQPGYSIIDIYEDTVTFVAEKRIRDNVIQVVMVPNSSGIKYKLKKTIEGQMGAPEWHFKEPLLKIYGNLSQVKNKAEYHWAELVISILIRPVNEFSFTKAMLKKGPCVLVYRNKVPLG